MLVLGRLLLKNYDIWVANPNISENIFSEDSNYFEIKICRKEMGWNIFVDLFTAADFKSIFCLENNRPTDKTDMIEYQSFMNRKGMSMPLFKVTRQHVEYLIDKCIQLDKGIL